MEKTTLGLSIENTLATRTLYSTEEKAHVAARTLVQDLREEYAHVDEKGEGLGEVEELVLGVQGAEGEWKVEGERLEKRTVLRARIIVMDIE